jgi:hypothetical protein
MKAPVDTTIQTEQCSRLPTCVEEHHLIVDGEATPEMIAYYEQIGAYCPPCSRHYKDLLALKTLVIRNTQQEEPPTPLSETILQKIANS